MSNIDYFKKFMPVTTDISNMNFDVWSYTRVSSKEQFTNNSSVSNQIKHNIKYAKEQNYNIVENFGGTYESAKSDFTRKEFKRLIDKIKTSKKKPYAILVFKMSRFSRSGGNAIGLVNQLVEELKVHLIETSTGNSTTTERGKVAIYESLFHAYKENIERMEIIIPAMQTFIKNGGRFGSAPIGYDHYGPRVKKEGFLSSKQRFEINKTGIILKDAWKWKASGLYNDVQIIDKLAVRGVKVRPQYISSMWRNPFYCGINVNRMVDEPVQGDWEKIVSVEDFKKVQDVIFKKPHDHLHNIENDKRPLTHLINCIHCESILVGYEVKKKGLHYYRCPKCNGVSVNANTTPKSKRIGANDLYKDFLKGYTLEEDFIPVLKFQIEKLYDYHNDHNKVDQENLMAQKRELEGQLKSLKIRLGLGEIDTETFSLTNQHIQEKMTAIESKIDYEQPTKSNLEIMIDDSLMMASQLNVVWDRSDLENKKVMSRTLFPEGVLYDPENHRYLTKNVNSYFGLINTLSTSYKENKKGINQSNADLSPFVARPGFEPGTSGL
jgi:DNA invertase Pin-like site-specific DNA recombinase